jgi:hypothetical protein
MGNTTGRVSATLTRRDYEKRVSAEAYLEHLLQVVRPERLQSLDAL